MAINETAYRELKAELDEKGVSLIAVSKTRTAEEILSLYNKGHRDFGENYVREMAEKASVLPPDIRWNFIGHLQTNKVKLIVGFVHLVQSVDSIKLLKEINKQAEKAGRIIDCLLQVHIAKEESKFGFAAEELDEAIKILLAGGYPGVRVNGLMGMASFTEDTGKIKAEFSLLRRLFDKYRPVDHATLRFKTLSMGMTGDYRIAIEEGSNMVRIGTLIFGTR
jgi:PLP dependent protein